jgi:hypothetical protein
MHTSENKLAHDTVKSMPKQFTEIGQYPMQFQMAGAKKTAHLTIVLWRYEGTLPEGGATGLKMYTPNVGKAL